jgi:hypothetical protein
MNTAYSYHPKTGEILGEVQYRSDPLDGTAPPPANATIKAPPRTGDYEVAIWADDAWTIKPDHRGTEYWLADGSHHTIIAIGEVPPEDALDAAPPKPREDQRKTALARIDQEHAIYLVALTGDATVAERDTWRVKEEAARAFEAGTATPGQTAMLAAEAQCAGITEAELAATIIAKADAFLTLIGLAAGLRAKGRAAIMAATDEAVPLDGITKRIDQVFSELNEDVQAAIASFQSG